VTGSERIRMRYRFPRFFLIIVEVQNVSLRMTDMATGSDVTEGHVIPSGVPLEVCAHVQPVPAHFSYYSNSTKCINAHDRHGYRK
jgi:hypothetical protein